MFEILVLVLGCLVLYQWVLVFGIASVGVVSQLVLDVWHAPVSVVSADREKSCLCVWFCKSTGSSSGCKVSTAHIGTSLCSGYC